MAEQLFLTMLGDESPPPGEMIQGYLSQADAVIGGYLGLCTLPEHRFITQARVYLALALYNRRGAEGESSRREGDVASAFEDLPEVVKLQLRPFRKARALPRGKVQDDAP